VWRRSAKPIDRLATDRKLKDGCVLAGGEQGDQHDPSVRKFERIMVAIGKMRVDLAKARYAEAGFLGPNPTMVEFNILFERQFGTRQQADRDLSVFPWGKAGGRCQTETGRYELFANYGGAGLYGVQAVVTHGALLSAVASPHRDWPKRYRFILGNEEEAASVPGNARRQRKYFGRRVGE
jgi:hypothetical protein